MKRWKEAQYRFPPYQYRREFCLQDAEHHLRLLDSSERELLMGFGAGHTEPAMSASEAKQSPTAYEDKRLSLIGDSFAMVSFAWVNVPSLLSNAASGAIDVAAGAIRGLRPSC